MSEDCQRCADLERRIERMERQIRKIRRTIEQARQVCYWYMQQAQRILSQRSGVPRGTWAFWRGVYQVAAHVLAILNKAG